MKIALREWTRASNTLRRRTTVRNTSLTGEVCRTQIIAALALQGRKVLVPMGDFLRYDLGIDLETPDGRFLRVQCKTGRLRKGAVVFYPCSVDSRSERGRCICKSYAGQVEYFGVYCPDLKKCYPIPAGDATTMGCSLRVDPPRNGQKTRIRWAEDYEIK
jgi:hypothetical protein